MWKGYLLLVYGKLTSWYSSIYALFFRKKSTFFKLKRFLTIIKTDLLQDVSNENKDHDLVVTKFSYFIGLWGQNMVLWGFENWVWKWKLQWSSFFAKILQWSFETHEILLFWKITAIFFHFSNFICIWLSLHKSPTKHPNSVVVVTTSLNRPCLAIYTILYPSSYTHNCSTEKL